MSSIEINTSESEAGDLQVPLSYNIHSRPKRAIHSEPISASNFQMALEDSDESEDEDFMPDESHPGPDKEPGIELDESSIDASNIETETNVKETPAVVKESITTVKKKRKYKKRKQMPFADPQSDEETKKILNSFRNRKIVIKKKPKPSKLANKSTKVKTNVAKQEDSDLTVVAKAGTGPFVRRIESGAAPMYMVYQSHLTNDSNYSIESNTKKGMVVREKAPPITDQSVPWVCSLCHMRPYAINGLGGLFGPYRVSSLNELDEDQTIEYKASIKGESDGSTFKEIWLHEGCAVWTPNLYFIQNTIKGIWSVLESSSKLVSWAQVVLFCYEINMDYCSHRSVCRVRRMVLLWCVTSMAARNYFTSRVPS